jgi:two-component system, cell cycle response regulator
VRLGANLSAFLHGRGRAFRMGGDEFCAVFQPGDAPYDAMVHGAAAALSEHGDGFSITCSHGAITLPVEAIDPVEALRIADQRMYANKHAGRTSAGRQSKDVLLRALAERDPGLGTHAETVALAAATAEALGLTPDEIEHVRHASELHDVGKVAIPDAILGKPGPLTEEEWTFVRRHPIIGERIILAAPALARVAALVRSSHERWDGGGYPDALSGDTIPVGARIVSVADAFAAMTAGRPYRPARTVEDALAELRRGAGAQFDPAVVDAWCAAHQRRGLPAVA